MTEAAGFAAGLVVLLAVGWRSRVSLVRLGLGLVALGLGSLVLFATTYRDEFCDEDTACRLLAGPAWLILSAVLPGMAAGLVVVAIWRASLRMDR